MEMEEEGDMEAVMARTFVGQGRNERGGGANLPSFANSSALSFALISALHEMVAAVVEALLVVVGGGLWRLVGYHGYARSHGNVEAREGVRGVLVEIVYSVVGSLSI